MFLWCVLRALNPSKCNPQRLDEELMGKKNILNTEGIDPLPYNLLILVHIPHHQSI